MTPLTRPASSRASDQQQRPQTSQKSKRHHVPACQACQARRVRCDGKRPCEVCSRYSIPCVDPPPPNPSGGRPTKPGKNTRTQAASIAANKRATYVRGLKERIQAIEQAIQEREKQKPGGSLTTSDQLSPRVVGTVERIDAGGNQESEHTDITASLTPPQQGSPSETDPPATSSSASSSWGINDNPEPLVVCESGEPKTLAELRFSAPSAKVWKDTKIHSVSASTKGLQAPQESLDFLVHLFFKSTFLANLPNQPRVLLYAIYAISARYSDDPYIQVPDLPRWNWGDAFYEQARRLLMDMIDSDPCLEYVAALHLLANYAGAGMASRMALGLHLDVDPDLLESCKNASFIQKETRRRLWWCTFTLEQLVASAQERASSLPQNAQVQIPVAEQFWDLGVDPATLREEDIAETSTTTNAKVRLGVLGFVNANPYAWRLVQLFTQVTAFVDTLRNSQSEAAATAARTSNEPNYVEQETEKALEHYKPMLSKLDVDLKNHWASLPPVLRDLPDPTLFQSPNTAPPSQSAHDGYSTGLDPTIPYIIPNTLYLYYVTIVKLHRPFVIARMKDCSSKGCDKRERKITREHPSYLAALDAARKTTDMTRKLLSVNPHLHFVTPHAMGALFDTACIHILAFQVDSTPEILDDLHVHIRALEGMGLIWYTASLLCGQLRIMVETACQLPSSVVDCCDLPGAEEGTHSDETGTPVLQSCSSKCAGCCSSGVGAEPREQQQQESCARLATAGVDTYVAAAAEEEEMDLGGGEGDGSCAKA
ncbi:hypothetical protein HK102_005619 [Quaeritorhiza haematococci]|nr:hypothetical protein HK102_005619 [Quaeritorhiza haematococci]